ncbi:MAG TPA: hypothetical protein VJ574_03445, partial [Candidatus Bathyarchaeia archaeon]|nr:hypothetical protein [Candidatus Bathyarchaeia archaeon]
LTVTPFQGMGRTSLLRKCYLCPENMCYRCLEKILLPMSRSGSGGNFLPLPSGDTLRLLQCVR